MPLLWKTKSKEYAIEEMSDRHLAIAYKKTIERFEESSKFLNLQKSLLDALESELEKREIRVGEPTTPAMKERHIFKKFYEKHSTGNK